MPFLFKQIIGIILAATGLISVGVVISVVFLGNWELTEFCFSCLSILVPVNFSSINTVKATKKKFDV